MALIASGVALTGVDLDERSLEGAQERLPAGEFLCASASTAALGGGGRFDVLLIGSQPTLPASP